jgi:hypothetical protein
VPGGVWSTRRRGATGPGPLARNFSCLFSLPGTAARVSERTGNVADDRAENQSDCWSAMAPRSGFWSDLKTARWVVVPGRSRSLPSFPPVTVISGSVFSSHSPGSRFVAYKLDSFHPSHLIPAPAQSLCSPPLHLPSHPITNG